MIKLFDVYTELLDRYGFQGWWPLVNRGGYHPKDYNHPIKEDDVFEICIGAILTQNTSWTNVEKALINLNNKGLLEPDKLINASIKKVKDAIKPAGYFNQKAEYLKSFALFFKGLNGVAPQREELLNVKGVGPETADSILLYAYKIPSFVVDAYTKRIFSHLGLISKDDKYDNVKRFFEENLSNDYQVYQEFHALIVEHAKRHYSRKPYGVDDFLKKLNL